jgi:hypothetical protein
LTAWALSVEPEWHNFDQTNGETVSNYALETKIEADAELIKNRLFYAFNIPYEPEGTITGANPTGWDPESTFGVSSALAFQVIPNIVIGADLWYLRHYEGLTSGSFTGDAVYLGPTFFWKIGPKTLVSASWERKLLGAKLAGRRRLISRISPTNVHDCCSSLNFSPVPRRRGGTTRPHNRPPGGTIAILRSCPTC